MTDTTLPATTDPMIWRVLAIAVATQAAGSFVSQGVYILVPLWRDAFGVSLAAASLAATAMNGAQIATLFAIGQAIDRWGERRVVGAAMVVMAAMMALAAMAGSLSVLLLCIGLMGAAYAAVQTGGTRAILRWFPPRQRGLATGFRQAAVPFGTAVAAAMLPVAAALHGWQSAVWLQAAVALGGGVLFFALYREGEGAVAASAEVLSLSRLLPVLGADRDFWPVMRAGIAMSAFQFTLTAHAIGYLAHGGGMELAAAAGLFALAQILGIPGRVLLPWASDRWLPGRRIRSLGWVMLLGALAATGFVVLGGTASLGLLAALGLLGIFGIGWYPLYILQIAEMAPRGSIASTVSLATTMCMVVMALGPFLFGLAVDLAGYGPAWALLLLPVVVTAWPLCRSRRRALAS